MTLIAFRVAQRCTSRYGLEEWGSRLRWRKFSKRVKHLLLRIPKSRIEILDFRNAHNKVVAKKGSVWVGINGQRRSAAREREVIKQLENDIPTYFYVTQMTRPGGPFATLRSRVLDVASSYSQIESSLVPQYYSQFNVAITARFWIKTQQFELLSSKSVNSLRIAQSGKYVHDVMRRSMVALMFVCERSVGGED